MTTPSALSAALQDSLVHQSALTIFRWVDNSAITTLFLALFATFVILCLVHVVLLYRSSGDSGLHANTQTAALAIVVFCIGMIAPAIYFDMSSAQEARRSAASLASIVERKHPLRVTFSLPYGDSVVTVTDVAASDSTIVLFGSLVEHPPILQTVDLTLAQAQLADRVIRDITKGQMALATSSFSQPGTQHLFQSMPR